MTSTQQEFVKSQENLWQHTARVILFFRITNLTVKKDGTASGKLLWAHSPIWAWFPWWYTDANKKGRNWILIPFDGQEWGWTCYFSKICGLRGAKNYRNRECSRTRRGDEEKVCPGLPGNIEQRTIFLDFWGLYLISKVPLAKVIVTGIFMWYTGIKRSRPWLMI